MMFSRNTLTFDEAADSVRYMAAWSIEFYFQFGRLPDTRERVPFMTAYLEEVNAKCSYWRLSKLTLEGVGLAITVLEDRVTLEMALIAFNDKEPLERERMLMMLGSHARMLIRNKNWY